MQGDYIEINGKTGDTRIIDNIQHYGMVEIAQGNNKIWIHPDDIEDFIDGIKKIEEAI